MIAYLIDPMARSITEVEYDDSNYRNICELIDAQLFDVVRFSATRDVIFVDDEGLFNPRGFFRVDGYPSPLAGKGLVLGTNSEGESIEPGLSLEDLEGTIHFINHGTAVRMAEVLDTQAAKAKEVLGDSLVSISAADILKDQEYSDPSE
jgi:hypothetical protein